MWLVETVGKHAKAAGIGMPEVAIYDSPLRTPSRPVPAATVPWWRSARACSAA